MLECSRMMHILLSCLVGVSDMRYVNMAITMSLPIYGGFERSCNALEATPLLINIVQYQKQLFYDQLVL